jgi:hypothetical protein
MATLNFLRGSIKGKLGDIVGSSWRGKDYIKTYIPPSNPNTEGQAAVRTICFPDHQDRKLHIVAAWRCFQMSRTGRDPSKDANACRHARATRSSSLAVAVWESCELHPFFAPIHNV